MTSGGSGNENYLWSNGMISYTTASPANLTAGSWTLTVTDALTGCAADSVFVITQPPSLNIGVSPVTTSICAGSGVTLYGSSSGAAGISYSWLPLSGLSGGNTMTVSASPSVTTVYTLTGILNGCSEGASATIAVVSPPNLNVSLNSATTCAEALNGSANTITLTAAGALTYTISTPNDIFNSNPSGPVANLNTLPPHIPGVSTATVYGSNGVCTVSASAVFTIIPNPTVSISNPTPVICAGQSYTYTNAGADSYTWSSSAPGQTIYTVGNAAVFDATTNAMFSVFGGSLGCNSATQSTTITVIPVPQVSVNPNPAITCSGTPVQLHAIGTGTQYTWNPPYWLDTDTGDTVSANPPALQIYTVVASLNSCTNAAMVTVSLIPSPTPTIHVIKQNVCVNDSIELYGSGGISYSWSGPVMANAQGQSLNLKVLSSNFSGMYTLTVSDQNHCRGSATQSITVLGLPDGYFDPASLQGCAPLRTGLSFQTAPYSASIISISWQVNNSSFSGSSFSYLFENAGNYPLTGYLADVNHCTNTVTAQVNVYPKPHADFSFVPEQPVEDFETVQFSNQSVNATSFNWTFMNNQNESSSENPVFLFEDAGYYPVALVAENQWHCKDTAVKGIAVAPDFVVYIPNAFTPNDDGRNELYRPVFRGIHSFTFYIFDRWGELLFETTDPASGWNGSYKGEPCQQDMYVWKLVLSTEGSTTNAQQQKEMTGQVLLYR